MANSAKISSSFTIPLSIGSLRAWLKDWGYWINTGAGATGACALGWVQNSARSGVARSMPPQGVDVPAWVHDMSRAMAEIAAVDTVHANAIDVVKAVYRRRKGVTLEQMAESLDITAGTLDRRRDLGERLLLVWYRAHLSQDAQTTIDS